MSTSECRETLPRRVTSRLLQLVLWIIATGISVSRVTDNMHHVTDVIAGAAVGLIVALWTVSAINVRDSMKTIRQNWIISVETAIGGQERSKTLFVEPFFEKENNFYTLPCTGIITDMLSPKWEEVGIEAPENRIRWSKSSFGLYFLACLMYYNIYYLKHCTEAWSNSATSVYSLTSRESLKSSGPLYKPGPVHGPLAGNPQRILLSIVTSFTSKSVAAPAIFFGWGQCLKSGRASQASPPHTYHVFTMGTGAAAEGMCLKSLNSPSAAEPPLF